MNTDPWVTEVKEKADNGIFPKTVENHESGTLESQQYDNLIPFIITDQYV